ncbi:MAG: Trm112 family protein [Thermoplasmata archaeon]|nr:MAG: Trm112 family protein [Thermoplasmata archaeon]
MKKDLMDIICCPTCKSPLILSIEKEEKDEVIEGSLICETCNVSYEIEDSIPNLLPKKPSS